MLMCLAAALALAGCGDFWQPPNGTGSTGTTASTTTLAASSSSVAVGASVTLTATVSPTAATGTVTFDDGTSSIGTGTLASGTATLTTSFTAAGAQSLTAIYGGSSTYASSTSSAVTVTVTAASSSAAKAGTSEATAADPLSLSGGTHNTSTYQSPAILSTGVFSATGGTYTAGNAEAAVVEGNGSAMLNAATLSASAGDDRGVLLYQSGSSSAGDPSLTMTGGSITYNCSAASTPACAQGSTASGQNNPATLFSVANATAAISLTDVAVTNNTATALDSNGTLLTAEALKTGTWGVAGSNGGHVTFQAQGTALIGDVLLDSISTASLSILEDSSGTGSSLTGAINNANTGKTVNLTLDPQSTWTVTGTSFLTNLSGLDLNGATVNNIDGGGHCVYYSGSVNGSTASTIYLLTGGGYLAPAATTGLACD